ncbi:hypothetical protein CI109_102250 [Kwoniella shandongensis]|uniref:Uncharacterized protein n=1 Tax=Kwoniella shandongensis TaxID=1734106 RepID=A0A5M6C1W7_9TREE|nr:uncharacterized protein CI109_003596 [Kwoniella shandongensis]KAA5527942.1 hypothetical protein CI109_003596 [Kwoniella shandongensis]
MPTVLITGCNRGIGQAFLKAYRSQGWTVIAGVRDPSTVTKEDGLIVVKIESDSTTDAKAAVEELKWKYGVEKLDLVIANAAVHLTHAHLKDVDPDILDTTWKVNVRGPLILFQAFYSLLGTDGKFVIISSGAGRIGKQQTPGGGAYGQSKAAVNFLVAKLHVEHPDLVVLALNPGWVETDMGTQGAKWSGMDKTPLKVSDTLPGMLKVIEEAKKDTTSGKLVDYDGSIMSW